MSLPPTITTLKGRTFSTFPAAVLAIIIDPQERFLMLSHPNSDDRWEVVNGALEANETILEGVLREIREEAGTSIEVRPVGTLHTYTFRYDEVASHVISVCYLLEYVGGEVIPGDDMRGSRVGWFGIEEIETLNIVAPRDYPWLFRRAAALYRVLKEDTDVTLQPKLGDKNGYKYDKSQL